MTDDTALIVRQEEQLTALGNYVGQLAAMVAVMREELEQVRQDNARKITVNHQQALQLQRMIRIRAIQVCEKYHLDPWIHAAALRSAIKKDVLSRWGIPDLHDLPQTMYDAASDLIKSWTSFTFVMRRRKMDAQRQESAASADG